MNKKSAHSLPGFLNKKKPVLYTTTPPKNYKDISLSAENLKNVFSDKRIAAISAPELTNRLDGQGNVTYAPNTIPPEDFLGNLPAKFEKITTLVVHRVPKEKFVLRLNHIKSNGIRTAILVGPEQPGDIGLLGGHTLKEGFNIASKENFTLGGITIPWRQADSSFKPNVKQISECERIALKQEYGCRFLTSQLIFESQSAISLLNKYSSYCEEKNLEPLTIFFSFCVVPSRKTLDFMYGLYVDIPAPQRWRLLNSANMEKESIQVAAEIWGAILDVQKSNSKNIKVGLQIEQIKSDRVDKSLDLLDKLYSVS